MFSLLLTDGGFDPSAIAFINAAGITNNIQKVAINTLVVSLKANNIWTKIKAFYPMVGGTATNHKYNLKDPRDLDIAFRLNFIGGWTHSSTGALPNGSTGYANTFFTPSSNFSGQNNKTLFYYGAGTNSQLCLMGANGTLSFDVLIPNFSNGNVNFSSLSSGTGGFTSSGLIQAMHVVTRTISGSYRYFRNTTKVTISDTSTGNDVNEKLTLSGRTNVGGVVAQISGIECRSAGMMDGLSDSEQLALYNATQAFNTSLSRQV